MFEIEQSDVYARWFAKLKDDAVRSRIDMRLRRLRKGNPGDVKPVGGGVWELRVHYGPGYRIYYFQKSGVLIVLLAGGDKRTQAKDIERAVNLAAAMKGEQ